MAVFTGNGSAASPSFTFSSDTNLGIYRGGEDIISFSTGGAESARLNAAGDLEIGGTPGSDPNISLNTNGSADFVGDITFSAGQSIVSGTATSGASATPGLLLGTITSGTYSGSSQLTLLSNYQSSGSDPNNYFLSFSSSSGANVAKQLKLIVNTQGDIALSNHANGAIDDPKLNLYSDGSAYFSDQVDIGGSPTSPNISLNGSDGSAYFADQVDIGGTELSPNIILNEGGRIDAGGFIGTAPSAVFASVYGYQNRIGAGDLDLTDAITSAFGCYELTLYGAKSATNRGVPGLYLISRGTGVVNINTVTAATWADSVSVDTSTGQVTVTTTETDQTYFHWNMTRKA